MAIDIPSDHLLEGDLARVKSVEADDSWPDSIEIVAYWQPNKRGKRRSVVIGADRFFGRKGFNAPMSGDEIIMMINKLRRS